MSQSHKAQAAPETTRQPASAVGGYQSLEVPTRTQATVPIDRGRSVGALPLLKDRRLVYVLLFVGLAVGYGLMRGSTWRTDPQAHTILEALATALALMVGVMALVRFYSKKNNTLLFIGAAFLGTAFLDGYHAVVTSTYFSERFPSTLDSLIPWSWVASRFFLSMFLFLSWFYWKRQENLGDEGRISEWAIYVATGVATLTSFMFFAFFPLPRAYYPELFFHRPEEFIPAAFFLFALIGYLRKGRWRDDPVEHWLVQALIVGFMGQAVFMSFSGQLFDVEFDAAHLLKNVSYVFVLVGLLISMYRIFRHAEDSTAKLEQQVEDLARSNGELEHFASVAAHDLQEPLRKVQAFGDRLSATSGDALDERGRDYVDRMQSAARRMQLLIDSLLGFSQVGTRDQPFEQIDLAEIAEQAIVDLEIPIEEAGAVVRVGDLPTIDGDPLQMRQLLQNLIGNALKYRRDDETAVIDIASAEPVITPADASNGLCHIAVQDNGIGFEPQYAEQIFRMFERLHGRTEYLGTGMGLAICRKIVERHGGTITATGTPGVGSTFMIAVPQSQESRRRAA